MRDSLGGIAVERHAANPRRSVMRDGGPRVALRTRFGGEPTVGRYLGSGRAEADHGRDVLEPALPGAPRAADDERREPQPAAYEQRRRPSVLRTCGALTEHRSAPRAPKSTGTCPAAMHASTWTSTPSLAPPVALRGLDRADLVVGELHRDERGFDRTAASTSVGS